MKTKHTPTPWVINGRFIDCKQMEMICEFPQSSEIGTEQEDVKEMGVNENRWKENAAFIVKAVNNHEELCNAVEDLLVFFSEYEDDFGEIVNPLMVARQVLAKAKGV